MRIKRVTRIATLDLRIDYLRPAEPPRDVRARAECYKAGKQVAFVRAIAFHDDDQAPIASAAGTFMIFDDSRSPVGKALADGGG
jgi:acyl-coenzyme A thioesterase PaaI-like protein